jgi:hypothetical protein
MKTTSIFGLLTVLSLAAVLVVNWPLLLGQGVPSAPQSATQAYQVSSNGLWLQLSISQGTVAVGQSLVISVDSYNPTGGPLNVTTARAWAVQGLRADSCYSSVYPFGLAVFQGTYTAGNVSQGKPLQIFPNVPCPMLIRLVTGYYFSPDSSNATVLPGTGSSISISIRLAVAGTYPGQGTTPQPFTTGSYTVVAGDEWGTLVFLHFQVR